MKLRMLLLLLTVVGLITPSMSQSRQKEADDMYRTLKKGLSAKDSIRILFDVYDLADQDKKNDIGWKIIGVAERSKDYETLYDIIPFMSADATLDPELQKKLKDVTSRLPEGEMKRRIETFVMITDATQEGSYLTPEERHKRILTYLQDEKDSDDVYKNFLDLYRVVAYMGMGQNGNIYMEYLDRLVNMLEDLPDKGSLFQSRIYTTAANYYTRNGYPEKAVEMDRKLLTEYIPDREKFHRSQGRKYRNYDRYKYLCYLRMLSNYRALKPTEVEEYYKRCEELAQKSEEIREHFYDYRQADSYYLMANKRYAEAIPALHSALARAKSRMIRYTHLAMLKEAAEQTNNNEVLVESLNEYVKMLEDRLNANSEGVMQELQIRYEVRKIEEEKRKAEEEKLELELSADDKVISLVLITLFVLVIVIMFLGRKHFSLIRNIRDYKESNDKLNAEIEELLYLRGGIPGTEDLHDHDQDGKEK